LPQCGQCWTCLYLAFHRLIPPICWPAAYQPDRDQHCLSRYPVDLSGGEGLNTVSLVNSQQNHRKACPIPETPSLVDILLGYLFSSSNRIGSANLRPHYINERFDVFQITRSKFRAQWFDCSWLLCFRFCCFL
jgi:hypothetical protein